MTPRSVPQDIEAEQSVLGACLLDPRVAGEILPGLTDEDFVAPKHREIRSAMAKLLERGDPIDEMTVGGALREQGAVDAVVTQVSRLTDVVPTAANATHWVRRLRDLALRRELIRAAAQAIDAAGDETRPAADVLDRAAATLGELAAGRPAATLATIGELGPEYRRTLDRRWAGDAPTGTPTGFTDLDMKLLGGMRPGNLLILGARPSLGKTALATRFVTHAGLRFGGPVLVFSLEMTQHELLDRMVAAEAQLDLGRLLSGHLPDADRRHAIDVLTKLERAPIAIDSGGSTSLLEIRTKARRHKQRHHGLALVVVDYLQIVRAPAAETRDRQVAAISSGLKAIAMELGVPVLALSQLNRDVERRDAKRPQLSDIRDSGAVEQDADVIMFLEDHAKNEVCEAKLIVAKQRNGPTGPVALRWVPRSALFQSLARAPAAQVDIRSSPRSTTIFHPGAAVPGRGAEA